MQFGNVDKMQRWGFCHLLLFLRLAQCFTKIIHHTSKVFKSTSFYIFFFFHFKTRFFFLMVEVFSATKSLVKSSYVALCPWFSHLLRLYHNAATLLQQKSSFYSLNWCYMRLSTNFFDNLIKIILVDDVNDHC